MGLFPGTLQLAGMAATATGAAHHLLMQLRARKTPVVATLRHTAKAGSKRACTQQLVVRELRHLSFPDRKLAWTESSRKWGPLTLSQQMVRKPEVQPQIVVMSASTRRRCSQKKSRTRSPRTSQTILAPGMDLARPLPPMPHGDKHLTKNLLRGPLEHGMKCPPQKNNRRFCRQAYPCAR